MSFRGISLTVAVLVAVALMAIPGSATVLAPSGTVSPLTDAAISGTILASTGAEAVTGKDFFGNTKFTGTFASDVVLDLGTGFLDFVYQFSVATGSVDHLSAADFTGFVTDVSYSSVEFIPGVFGAPGTVAPGSASRSGDASTVDFSFVTTGGVGPGGQSDLLVIKTNASSFTTGVASLIDSGTANLLAYQPTPEPASVSLLLGGLLGAGMIVRKKLAKQS